MRFKEFEMQLDNELSKHLFVKGTIQNTIQVEEIIVWQRKTWNSNRAVVLIQLSEENIKNIVHLGKFSQKIKYKLGRAIGYKVFLYELGLQIIYYGDHTSKLANTLEGHVDRYNNQQVIQQSIHLLDDSEKIRESVRTWGQFITGKYQDIIENVMRDHIKK